MTRGVFSKSDLQQLVDVGRIIPLQNFNQSHIKEASVDVTVTDEIYAIDRVLQPNERRKETVRSLLPMMGARQIDLNHVLEVKRSYIAKASIDLNLSSGLYGFFNAKSTSGRLFVFVRTLADRICMFDSGDRRREGYSGEIWLVIEPLVFPIILNTSECLNQLRIFDADTRFNEPDLQNLLKSNDLLFRRTNHEAYKQSDLSLNTHDGTVLTTLFAEGEKHIGYKARLGGVKAIDLGSRKLDPRAYFDRVFAEQLEKDNKYSWGVCIEEGRHLLLSTNEMYKVPVECSSELVALDRRLGDIFTHFAGYFDPGFFGTGTLEVFSPRTVFLRHGQPLARFVLEKMRSETTSYNDRGTYALQIETGLPKQFADWD